MASGNPYAKETVYISSVILYVCRSLIELGLAVKALKNDIFQNNFFQKWLHIFTLKSHLMLELIANLEGFYLMIYESTQSFVCKPLSEVD